MLTFRNPGIFVESLTQDWAAAEARLAAMKAELASCVEYLDSIGILVADELAAADVEQ